MVSGTAREVWVCFVRPSEAPEPDVLVLSFMPPGDEADLATRWPKQVVSGRSLASDVRDQARSLYLDLVVGAAATPVRGRTLRQALHRGTGYSRWWDVRTSEKDSVWDADTTYTTLIRFFCARSVVHRSGAVQVRVFGGTKVFARLAQGLVEEHAAGRTGSGAELLGVIVRGWMARLYLAARYLFLWHLCRRLPRAPYADVLLEAHWDWSLHADDGRLGDGYFADLPDRLVERGVSIGWLASCEPRATMFPHETKRPIRQIVRDAARHPGVVLLERYITVSDVLRTACDFRPLVTFLRFERAPEFRRIFHRDGVALYPLLRRDLARWLADASLARWELIRVATARACQQAKPRMLISFQELFLYARALYAGARAGAPGIQIWAAQHASYSRDKTSGVLDAAREFAGEPDGCLMPGPDGLFVMGELARRQWVSNGFATDRVVVTGGLRYQHVRVRPAAARPRRSGPVRLMLIASMIEAIDLDMCRGVMAAAADEPAIEISIRNHPRYDLTSRTGFAPFRDRLRVTRGTVDEDLDSADLVMFTYSGLAEEALLRGLPIWQWRWPGTDASVFLDLPVIPTFSSSLALCRELRDFITDRERFRPTMQVQQLVLDQCFGPHPAQASRKIAGLVSQMIGAPQEAPA